MPPEFEHRRPLFRSIRQNATLAALDKLDDVFNLVGGRKLFQLFQGLRQAEPAQEKGFVGILDGTFLLFRKAGSAQSYGIEARDNRRIAIGHRVGDDIFHDLGAATDNGIIAYLAELVDGDESGDEGLVANVNVSCKHAALRKDVVVTDHTVMSEVDRAHKVIAIAYAGGAIRQGATVDVGVFAKGVVVADNGQRTLAAIEAKILWISTQMDACRYAVPFTQTDAAVDVHMASDFCSFADFYIVGNDRVGANLHVVSNLRAGVDDGCRVMHMLDFCTGGCAASRIKGRTGRLFFGCDPAWIYLSGPVIDTHCHLDLIAREGPSVEECLRDAEQAGLEAVVQIATDLESSRYNASLAASWNAGQNKPRLYWTAGLHPENGERHDLLPGIFEILRENRQRDDLVGIGETGLDYFHSPQSADLQKESLVQHLNLAEELNLPVVIHARDDRQYVKGSCQALLDILKMVRQRPGLTGVLHCFTYSYEEAMPFVDLGWKVSFSGILTFKNSHVLQEAAVRLPLECIMVETDAPYLAPVPYRGKGNVPAYVASTLSFLTGLRAEKLGEDRDKVARKIRENSLAFLRSRDNISPQATA